MPPSTANFSKAGTRPTGDDELGVFDACVVLLRSGGGGGGRRRRRRRPLLVYMTASEVQRSSPPLDEKPSVFGDRCCIVDRDRAAAARFQPRRPSSGRAM